MKTEKICFSKRILLIGIFAIVLAGLLFISYSVNNSSLKTQSRASKNCTEFRCDAYGGKSYAGKVAYSRKINSKHTYFSSSDCSGTGSAGWKAACNVADGSSATNINTNSTTEIQPTINRNNKNQFLAELKNSGYILCDKLPRGTDGVYEREATTSTGLYGEIKSTCLDSSNLSCYEESLGKALDPFGSGFESGRCLDKKTNIQKYCCPLSCKFLDLNGVGIQPLNSKMICIKR